MNGKMTTPRISIVTPSFNQGRSLERTIRSVLDQGYPNLEYIIIDGASTDGSVDIIKRYERRLAYWVSEKDGGQYDAVNKGFAKSTGEIMAWLNSDDMYFPWTLRTVADILRQFADVNWITSLLPATWNTEDVVTKIDSKTGFGMHAFRRGNHTNAPDSQNLGFIQQESTFWRRRLWEQAGGRVDEKYRLAADFELWFRFFQHTPLHGIKALLGGFRYYEQQRSVLQKSEYMAEVQAILKQQSQSWHDVTRWFPRPWKLGRLWPLTILPSLGFVEVVENIAWDYHARTWIKYSTTLP